jgi:hypothetical protein
MYLGMVWGEFIGWGIVCGSSMICLGGGCVEGRWGLVCNGGSGKWGNDLGGGGVGGRVW